MLSSKDETVCNEKMRKESSCWINTRGDDAMCLVDPITSIATAKFSLISLWLCWFMHTVFITIWYVTVMMMMSFSFYCVPVDSRLWISEKIVVASLSILRFCYLKFKTMCSSRFSVRFVKFDMQMARSLFEDLLLKDLLLQIENQIRKRYSVRKS